MPRSRLASIGGAIQQGSLYVLLFLLPFSIAAVQVLFGVFLVGWVLARFDPGAQRRTVWTLRQFRPLAMALAVYLLVCGLSIAVSDYPSLSVRGFIGKWLKHLMFLVMAADVGACPKVMRRCAAVLTISSVFVVIEAVTQEFFGKGIFRGIRKVIYARMTGPYYNPVDLGTYLMICVLLLLTYAVVQRKAGRWLVWGVLGLLVACLGRTLALGVWMATAVAVIAVLVPSHPVIRRHALVMMGIITVSAGLCLQTSGHTRTILASSNPGIADRVVMWKTAVGMIRDRPVLGHGVNTFMANYLRYYVGGEHQPRYAHNCYLQVAAETGLIGLSAFLWLLWCLLLRIRSSLQPPFSDDGLLLVGLLAGLVAFLVQSSYDTNFYSARQAALFWVLAGLAVGLSLRTENGSEPEEASVTASPLVKA